MRFKTIRVFCKKCKEWVDESEVQVLDISEDIQGRDVLTFICSVCKTEQVSHRVS